MELMVQFQECQIFNSQLDLVSQRKQTENILAVNDLMM